MRLSYRTEAFANLLHKFPKHSTCGSGTLNLFNPIRRMIIRGGKMSILTSGNIQFSGKLSVQHVESFMKRVTSRFSTLYSRVWENSGFKIEYFVGARMEAFQGRRLVVITIEKGPSDSECSLSFFGPREDIVSFKREIEIAESPENWGTCYFCGASYYYHQNLIHEDRTVVCQNCAKRFKLDVE